MQMPRLLIWTQVLIVVFVLAGIVIAITSWPERGMFESILVGTDGSETAGKAVVHALRMASALGARLQIVSAYEPIPERRLRIERVHAHRRPGQHA